VSDEAAAALANALLKDLGLSPDDRPLVINADMIREGRGRLLSDLPKGQGCEAIADVGRLPASLNTEEEEDGKERQLSDLTKGHSSEENTTVGRVPVRLNADFEEEEEDEDNRPRAH
jgi:hypothetical protein